DGLMELLIAVILGIIQGLTEFLPISSSAHLILVPWFLGWDPKGLVFDVAVHVGTALAVLFFFRKEWLLLARETIAGFRERSLLGNQHRKLFWLLVVGTLPAMIIGLTFEDTVESYLRNPLITVFTLTLFGLLLIFAERKSRRNRGIEMFSWADAIWIGCCQAIALVPGVSRSGITMTAAMLRNSDRVSAARFSFLLSTPIIVGAGMLQGWRLIDIVRHPLPGSDPVQWQAFIFGIAAAAITGFFCIKFFLRYLQTKSFTPFVVYRFVLAGVVLLYYLRVY
ncbi:MAG TPA: undecaprenyl-diphosphate phosphatase, partial [Acidobacteriota bacterium]|nr:undecaprenyl-diphosphate phosphatase [Acidobacteriota bacterium]